MKANVIIAILIVLGIFGHVQAYRERPATAICGTDFPIFYAGAKLLGAGDLYSPAALERIENGTYGICTGSGLPIPKERLRAIPWATERVEYKVGGFGRR